MMSNDSGLEHWRAFILVIMKQKKACMQRWRVSDESELKTWSCVLIFAEEGRRWVKELINNSGGEFAKFNCAELQYFTPEIMCIKYNLFNGIYRE